MKKILSTMRRAIQDYRMIAPGDKIAVGVSGGKDSVTLLTALWRLRQFYPVPFAMMAITLDAEFGGEPYDFSPVAELCGQIDVPYVVRRTDIGRIVFDWRRESNPCSLCAKMRRGALHSTALEYGCNKVALAHHMDDAVETFLMNLLYQGRLGCFSPVTDFAEKRLTLIRPLIYTQEKEIRAAVRREHLPVIGNPCPADGHTERQRTKRLIRDLDRQYHGFKIRAFGALKRSHLDGW